MGQTYPQLTERLVAFIQAQHIFFVATAADGRINLSPKGMDSLRVLTPNRIIWLNVTGSGNETAAHVQENPRMTLMFAAFEGDPMILRVYGQARAIHRKDPAWHELKSYFPPIPGARQIFDLDIDLVQTSCGMGVPLFKYQGERGLLEPWARKLGDHGIVLYWAKHNRFSLDGKPTYILEKSVETE